MTILADWQIREQITIVPFSEGVHRPGVISYGLTSFGYDMRVGRKFKVFNIPNDSETSIDPKRNDWYSMFEEIDGDYCIIPPNSFALAESVEYFEIPRDVLAVCLGKSTYARVGLVLNVTPLEPEWRGKITLELSNTTPLPAKVYANEGVGQIIFHRADHACERSYADKKGKYQDQAGLTLPIVE